MSAIGLIMNALLAVLLLAALGMGVRLNGRLKALRDSHEGFATAVHELNAAAARAEQGLADLRAASDEALDILSDRISAGRGLAQKLEALIGQASQIRSPAARRPEEPELDRGAERRLGALLAAAREARPARASDFAPIEDRPPRRAAPVSRPRFTIDDDIFDDEPLTLDNRRTATR
jgi:hypothetical protein